MTDEQKQAEHEADALMRIASEYQAKADNYFLDGETRRMWGEKAERSRRLARQVLRQAGVADV